jgi:hypothetical protein
MKLLIFSATKTETRSFALSALGKASHLLAGASVHRQHHNWPQFVRKLIWKEKQ